jgi:inosine-uridine nucleoside N-ribohydrolase
MMDVVWDMETGDPDDFITLLWLLGHPKVNLIGITITPGGADQVGLVRWALKMFEREDIPVGTFHDPQWLAQNDFKENGTKKDRVSAWHYKTFGDISKSYEAERGVDVLERLLGPTTTLITGGPLKNLGALITRMSVRLYDRTPDLGRVFIQGGFAGAGVVPEEQQLPKFKGLATCPTYNLNGDPKSALEVVSHAKWFSDMRFISKNVCHGLFYDAAMHAEVTAGLGCDHTHTRCQCECHRPGVQMMHIMACCDPCEVCGVMVTRRGRLPKTPQVLALRLIHRGMSAYLDKNKEGKKFHDPLAAACALDPEIGTWAEVMLYRERGEWGSYLQEHSGIQIITGYDHERFVRSLVYADADSE